MSKKVINIIKNDKKGKSEKQPNKSTEIFNLNEEIIIGVNSKSVNNSKNSKKNLKENKRKKDKTGKRAKTKSKGNISNKSNSNRKSNLKNENAKSEKKKKGHKFLKIFSIIFLILLATVLLLLSPLFNVKSITVKNNSKVSKEEIISLSQINLGENIFKYININIMQNVKQNSYIEDVKVTRNYPSEIVIDVKERAPEYILKLNETVLCINSQGYILEVSNEEYELPEIIGYKTDVVNMVVGNRLAEEDLIELEKINQISNNAKVNEINDKILNYTIEKDRMILGLEGKKVAYIKNFTNINIKILSLKTVLERTEGITGEIFLDGQGEESSILFRENV